MSSFAKESLDAHNRYRASHGSPAMKWSDSMAKEAEEWAKKLAKEGKLKHATPAERKNDGENVYAASGKDDVTGGEVVDLWYSEVSKYDFKKGGWQSGTGHFTQVVWKGSVELGVGKAKSSDGKIFAVGRYRPAGNLISAFGENVFPKK